MKISIGHFLRKIYIFNFLMLALAWSMLALDFSDANKGPLPLFLKIFYFSPNLSSPTKGMFGWVEEKGKKWERINIWIKVDRKRCETHTIFLKFILPSFLFELNQTTPKSFPHPNLSFHYLSQFLYSISYDFLSYFFYCWKFWVGMHVETTIMVITMRQCQWWIKKKSLVAS